MATQFDTQLQQLYVAYFNRPADPAGLQFYAGHLSTGATTMAAISAEFAKSAEYRAEYNQLTNAGVVAQVYQNLFGRAPDSAGQAYWVNALTNNLTTIDKMVTDIAAGAQTTDKVAYESKVQVAVAFTNALDTEAEATAYNNAAAQTAAKAMLSNIKTAEQATAAVVPATLDANVAAVVKAGTPFTLEGGLNALGAADKAIVDFYANAKIDVDGNGVIDSNDKVDAAAVAKNVDDTNETLAENIADKSFADRESVAVRAALIAEQEGINDKALVEAQTELTAARADTAKIAGLDNAIAASITATKAATDAQQAFVIADANEKAAVTVLEARNSTATIDFTTDASKIVLTPAATPGTGGAPDTPGTPVTLASLTVDGQWVVTKGLDASKYPGLTELVTARNVEIAAQADATEAEQASTFAQLEVEIRDQSPAGVTALSNITFSSGEVKVAVTGKPTVAEITNELSALESQKKDTGPFLKQVQDFLTANETVKADLVETRDDAVTAAQKTIADLAEAVTKYEEAQALATELKSLEDARAVAIKDFTDNKFAEPSLVTGAKFGTTGSDIFVFDGVNATITSFGRSGDDVLYVGSGYTLNTGALTTGNNAVLEVFFTQKGTSTEVTIESKAYGSESLGSDIHTITLTGVNAADLSFENGIISM